MQKILEFSKEASVMGPQLQLQKLEQIRIESILVENGVLNGLEGNQSLWNTLLASQLHQSPKQNSFERALKVCGVTQQKIEDNYATILNYLENSGYEGFEKVHVGKQIKVHKRKTPGEEALLLKSEALLEDIPSEVVFQQIYDCQKRIAWDVVFHTFLTIDKFDDSTDVVYCILKALLFPVAFRGHGQGLPAAQVLQEGLPEEGSHFPHVPERPAPGLSREEGLHPRAHQHFGLHHRADPRGQGHAAQTLLADRRQGTFHLTKRAGFRSSSSISSRNTPPRTGSTLCRRPATKNSDATDLIIY